MHAPPPPTFSSHPSASDCAHKKYTSATAGATATACPYRCFAPGPPQMASAFAGCRPQLQPTGGRGGGSGAVSRLAELLCSGPPTPLPQARPCGAGPQQS